MMLDHLRLMRPHQWLKNGFVFAGLIFSQSWGNFELIVEVLRAFTAFCFISSAVYVLNDWRDRAQDALHPVKKFRPLASGAVQVPAALGLAATLIFAGLGLALFNSGAVWLLTLLALYVAINLAYSWRLKQVPVVDVFMIASGFLIRLLAGTVAVGIAPSRWLLLTGLFVALFLGVSKRKSESFHTPEQQRAVLQSYSPALLDVLIAVSMTATITTYSLYAISPEIQALHGERLMLTVPLVVFGLFRYCYQVQLGKGEDVSKDLLKDPWILGAMGAWVLLFLSTKLF
jgi:4-hydroxybenzoate polyprenyltransferase